MKKAYSLLPILFLLALSQISNAQIETSLGFKGGGHLSSLSGKNVTNTKSKITPQIGGFINIGLANAVQFQMELLYKKEAGEFTGDGTDYKTGINYLDIPLLLKIRIPVNENVYPYLSIGQSVGYRLSDRTTTGGVLGSDEEVDGTYKNVNVSTLFGAGVDFDAKYVFFTFDARYNLGNINISAQDDFDLQTKGFSFTVGLGLKVGKN